MKKATIFAAALALVLSLAACGNQGAGSQTPNNQANNNGTVENGGSGSTNGTNGTNSANGANGTVNGGNDSSLNNGSSVGGSLTNPSGSTGSGTVGNGTGTGTGSTAGTGTGTGMDTRSRSTVGSDLRRAADNVGDAVTDLMDDGRNAMSRAASATTFERMLDNARVHDTDGVLTDGENSRW